MINRDHNRENGGQRGVPEEEERWDGLALIRDVLVVALGVLLLLVAIGGVCEFVVSGLDWRFDQQDKRFDQQDRRMDRIESSTTDRFGWSHDRMDRIESSTTDRFGWSHDRMDRIESSTADRFGWSHNRMDRIESSTDRGFRRSDSRMDRIEAAMVESSRQTHDRIDRTDARIDQLEMAIDVIEALLKRGRPQMAVEGDSPTSTPVSMPDALGAARSLRRR